MKKLTIILCLISLNSFALTRQECRTHYLEIIKSNNELKNTTGGEQVEFYLHPEVVLKKYKTVDMENDSILKSCLSKNN